jgi:hypothetical protein
MTKVWGGVNSIKLSMMKTKLTEIVLNTPGNETFIPDVAIARTRYRMNRGWGSGTQPWKVNAIPARPASPIAAINSLAGMGIR